MNTLADDDFVSPCGHMDIKIKALKRLILANKNTFVDKNATCAAPRCNKSWKSLWMCCTCGRFFCGYADNEHAKDHYAHDHHAIFFHLTCHDLWCYTCNSYKTGNAWLATIKPLTTITKDKLIKLEQSAAGSAQVDGIRSADSNFRQDGQTASRQIGKPAPHKPKITTLENMILHLNGTASFSHYNMAISQPKDEKTGNTGMSVQKIVHSKCFAKVPIHSHANTCYLNSILQVLAHLPPFAQYFITLQPILQSLDAEVYTHLLQQFTLIMIALQLVTDASVPPFINPVPQLSGKKLNIEALSIALFSFLPTHALGDLHDAHEIQMALFGLLNDGLRFSLPPQTYVSENLFAFLADNLSGNRNTVFSIFSRNNSEEALLHLLKRELLAISPFTENVLRENHHLLEVYLSACSSSSSLSSSSATEALKLTQDVASHLSNEAHRQDDHFSHLGHLSQLTFSHVVHTLPMTQDSSQESSINHYNDICHKCAFFDCVFKGVRCVRNEQLSPSMSQESGVTNIASNIRPLYDGFGMPIASYSSEIRQIFSYSNAKPQTLITQCFRGISQTLRKCNKCGSHRTRYEPFFDLLVPCSPEKTFLEELTALFSEEDCSGLHCDTCGTETHGSAHLSLYMCPDILITLQKQGHYNASFKQEAQRSQSSSSAHSATQGSQLTALSNFSLADYLSSTSPHRKYKLLMAMDVGTDFKVRTFLKTFIQYQMYAKLSHELIILIYELIMKSPSFLYNDSVTIVVAAMEYILRRFKASRILTSSAGISEIELTQALDLLTQIPTGFNLTAVSPYIVEYFIALLATHILYVFNCIFYILLLLSQNKLVEVEKALEDFAVGAPGVLEFLRRRPLERQSGRVHLLYILFTIILTDIQMIFSQFKMINNYKARWVKSTDPNDSMIQKDMKSELEYNIKRTTSYKLFHKLPDKCIDKFSQLFADVDIWRAGSSTYELASFIVHCNGNHYVAYIKGNDQPEGTDPKYELQPDIKQDAQSLSQTLGYVSAPVSIASADLFQGKSHSNLHPGSSVPQSNESGVLTHAADTTTSLKQSTTSTWYCFNDDKVTRAANPPISSASILYFIKSRSPIVEALKGYIWAELCSFLKGSGSNAPDWMTKIMAERAECIELLEILLGSHVLLNTALSAAHLDYDLSADFIYSFHSLHWPSLRGCSGHIPTSIDPSGPWTVSTILSYTLQPAQLARRYPIPGCFYYAISAIFDGSLTDYLERDKYDSYSLKIGPNKKMEDSLTRERALYNDIMATGSTGSLMDGDYLLSSDWIEDWGEYLFNGKKRPLALDNTSLLAPESDALVPILKEGLLVDLDYVLLTKQHWYELCRCYPSKMGHELSRTLLAQDHLGELSK